MSYTTALRGAISYEFTMQLRRRALWIGYLLLGMLMMAAFDGVLRSGQLVSLAHADTAVAWATTCNFILTLGAGLLLADRYRRDRATRTIELLRAAPAAASARLLGKYLGAVCATLVPMLAIYVVGVARMLLLWRDVGVLALAAAAFVALVVPPVFFVGAFSLACTTVLWQPLYMFLFVGYWLWTSLNPTGLAIPTLTSTLLSPGEQLVGTGFFGVVPPYPQDVGFYPASSVWLGSLNIVVLLACAACALVGGWWIDRLRAERGEVAA